MLNTAFFLVSAVVITALAFDFINGFHDTANAISASVSTRVLSPQHAIMIAATCNFLGAFSGTAVATTIGKGIVHPSFVTQEVVLAALLAAITWNLITWYYGIPSSSSHALIGGLIGAVITASGVTVLNLKGIVKVFTSLLISPLIGFMVGFTVMVVLLWLVKDTVPTKVNKYFSKLQILSTCFISFSHGSNDAQKSMGIITMALVSGGFLYDFKVPTLVILACALAMAFGTSVGGWRIIKTMGTKIFKLQPINGFAVDISAASVILAASTLGAPVSTTHVIAPTIMGVGASKRFSAVKWGIVGDIVLAWVLTLPICVIMASLFYFLISWLVG